MAALRDLWSRRQQQPAFVAASLVVLLVLLAYPAVDWYLRSIDAVTPFAGYDFGAYTRAADAYLAGDPIYLEDDDGGYHGSFLYPPLYVLAFVPFTMLPWDDALLAWQVVSVASLWVGLQLVAAAYRVELAIPERGLLLWAILGFQPLLLTVKLGQVTAVLGALLCGALAALVHQQRGGPGGLASGVLTTLGGTVKLIYLPAGAHLLQDRRRFIAAVATGLGLAVLSVAAAGIDAHLTYLDVLMWGKDWGESRPPTIWQTPYYRPLYVFGELGLAIRLGLVVAVAALAVLARGGDVETATFALGVAVITLAAPRAYTQDFVALLPAVLALVAVELDRDGVPAVPVVAVLCLQLHSHGLGWLAQRVTDGSLAVLEPVLPLLQLGLWGNLLLVGLAAARVAEAASLPDR